MGLGQLSPDVLSAGVAAPRRHLGHLHVREGGLSRRQFLRSAGAASGAVVAATVLRPALAFADTGSATPRPIPYGLPGSVFGDPTNTHLYHVIPPLPPGSDRQPGPPQYSDCSTITDFIGVVAAANINGTGTGTATPANPDGRFNFNVDMRFMKGTYVGVRGKRREGTFAFV